MGNVWKNFKPQEGSENDYEHNTKVSNNNKSVDTNIKKKDRESEKKTVLKKVSTKKSKK